MAFLSGDVRKANAIFLLVLAPILVRLWYEAVVWRLEQGPQMLGFQVMHLAAGGDFAVVLAPLLKVHMPPTAPSNMGVGADAPRDGVLYRAVCCGAPHNSTLEGAVNASRARWTPRDRAHRETPAYGDHNFVCCSGARVHGPGSGLWGRGLAPPSHRSYAAREPDLRPLCLVFGSRSFPLVFLECLPGRRRGKRAASSSIRAAAARSTIA